MQKLNKFFNDPNIDAESYECLGGPFDGEMMQDKYGASEIKIWGGLCNVYGAYYWYKKRSRCVGNGQMRRFWVYENGPS